MNRRVIILALMSAPFPAERLTATSPSTELHVVQSVDSPARSLSAIQVDVHAALRAEAATRRRRANTAEVVRLVDLYREMAAHPKRDQSALLVKLGLRVRSRLKEVSVQIERRYSQLGRNDKKKQSPSTLEVPETNVLAQQVAVQAGGAFGQAAQPAALAGAEAILDYGPELVDVIQQTISPATWNINGGNGAVVYFAPRRALVVSAPEAVHDKIDGVLGQLRAAP
jgi:hypothetical protein